MTETSSPALQRHRAREPATPRKRRRWPAVLGAVLLAVGVALIALPVWLGSDGGRDVVARLVERVVSGEIRGSLTIGAIDDLSRDGIRGRDVRFTDESGRLVLEADEAELDVDWGELLSGRFASPRGRVRGGRVVLETLESGALLLDRAFESPSPGPPGEPTGEDTVRLEALAISNVDVLVAPHGAPEIRIADLAAIVLLRAPEGASARLRADRIDGELHVDAPIPIDLTVEDGTLELDGDARRRAVIELPARRGDERIQVDVRLRADARDELHVDVRLTPSGLGAAIATAPLLMQTLLAETQGDMLDVTVDLP